MNRQLYSGRILEHYKQPRNAGVLEQPDLETEVSNPHCGDDLHFTARVKEGTLEELGFDGEGCALSVAAASMLTERVSGGELDAVGEVGDDEVFDMLGIQKDDIAPIRVKCVLLARDGLQEMVEEHE